VQFRAFLARTAMTSGDPVVSRVPGGLGQGFMRPDEAARINRRHSI